MTDACSNKGWFGIVLYMYMYVELVLFFLTDESVHESQQHRCITGFNICVHSLLPWQFNRWIDKGWWQDLRINIKKSEHEHSSRQQTHSTLKVTYDYISRRQNIGRHFRKHHSNRKHNATLQRVSVACSTRVLMP